MDCILIPVGYGIMAQADVIGIVCGDDFHCPTDQDLAKRDQCIADVASNDFSGPNLHGPLIDPEMDLAPWAI